MKSNGSKPLGPNSFRETGLMFLASLYLVGLLSCEETRGEVEGKTKNPFLHRFFSDFLVHLAFLRGDMLREHLWEARGEIAPGKPFMDLVREVLTGLVPLGEAHQLIGAQCSDPVLFSFFIEVLVYLSCIRNTPLSDPLRIAMDKWLRGLPPLPMEVDEIDWLYRWGELGTVD